MGLGLDVKWAEVAKFFGPIVLIKSLMLAKFQKKSNINCYIINRMFIFQFFFCLKLYIKNKFINKIINNI